jgi:hypothetical protein
VRWCRPRSDGHRPRRQRCLPCRRFDYQPRSGRMLPGSRLPPADRGSPRPVAETATQDHRYPTFSRRILSQVLDAGHTDRRISHRCWFQCVLSIRCGSLRVIGPSLGGRALCVAEPVPEFGRVAAGRVLWSGTAAARQQRDDSDLTAGSASMCADLHRPCGGAGIGVVAVRRRRWPGRRGSVRGWWLSWAAARLSSRRGCAVAARPVLAARLCGPDSEGRGCALSRPSARVRSAVLALVNGFLSHPVRRIAGGSALLVRGRP